MPISVLAGYGRQRRERYRRAAYAVGPRHNLIGGC